MSYDRLPDILARARITEVWQALGGDPPRRGRARAFWRDGDGLSVTLNDQKGCWYDFRDAIGGGIIGLIRHVRGGSRQDALKWLADLVGVPLADRPLSPAERQAYARRRQAAEAEARALLAWRARLIGALAAYRDEVFRAYHRGLRYIMRHGLDSPHGELAADVAELYEKRYQDLDGRLDLLRQARFGLLLPYFRAARQRRLAA